MAELLIAHNPDPDSTLPYLLRLPLAGGIVFRTSGTWPRTKALFCYQVSADEWPADPDIVERTRLRSCVRRGAAIDVVVDRSRESRSQIVFTKARARDVVFWQSPRTRKQARPRTSRTPTARAAGDRRAGDRGGLPGAVSPTEFRQPAGPQLATRARCRAGTTAVEPRTGGWRRSVERKSLADPVSQPDRREAAVRGGRAGGTVPRAAVVVEDRYSQVFKLDRDPALPGRRRSRRTTDPLAQRANRLLRRPANSPRNGPTGSWPPPTPGPRPSTPPSRCSPRWPSTTPRPNSTTHPTRRDPLPPKSGPGPAPPASPSPTAASSAPTSGTPGAAPMTPNSASFADASANGLPAETQYQDHLPQIRRRHNPFYAEVRIMPMWGGLGLVTAVTRR